VILAEREFTESTESISNGNGSNVVYKFISTIHNVMSHFLKKSFGCFGNAVYFFTMAIFSARVPLFISGVKKSVWVINEGGDSMKRAFKWPLNFLFSEPGCSKSKYSHNPDCRCLVFVFNPARNFIPSQICEESFR